MVHSKTKPDLMVFYENNNDEKLRKQITELHNLYDELQGTSLLNLSQSNIAQRLETFRFVVGFAFIVRAIEDENLDIFINDGTNIQNLMDKNPANDNLSEEAKSKKHTSPFFWMLVFERDLREVEKETSESSDVYRSVLGRLRNYRIASPHMTQSLDGRYQMGTSILYPILAIAHGIIPDIFAKDWEELITLVNNFHQKDLGIDASPIFEEFRRRSELKKQSPNVVIDYITPEQQENDRFDEPLTSTNYAEHIKIVISEQTIQDIAGDIDFVKSQDFIKYAKAKFLTQNNYNNLNLSNYIILVTDSIISGFGGGGAGSFDEVVCKPFKDAKTPKDIQDIFNHLPTQMQDLFLSNNYANIAIRELFNDIYNYKNLTKPQKNVIQNLVNKNKVLKEKFNNINEEAEYAKKRNKAIRRLFSLTKKDAEEKTLKI